MYAGGLGGIGMGLGPGGQPINANRLSSGGGLGSGGQSGGHAHICNGKIWKGFCDVHHTAVHLFDCSNYMDVDFQMHYQLVHLFKIIL